MSCVCVNTQQLFIFYFFVFLPALVWFGSCTHPVLFGSFIFYQSIVQTDLTLCMHKSFKYIFIVCVILLVSFFFLHSFFFGHRHHGRCSCKCQTEQWPTMITTTTTTPPSSWKNVQADLCASLQIHLFMLYFCLANIQHTRSNMIYFH